jgi:hypothetical protein
MPGCDAFQRREPANDDSIGGLKSTGKQPAQERSKIPQR